MSNMDYYEDDDEFEYEVPEEEESLESLAQSGSNHQYAQAPTMQQSSNVTTGIQKQEPLLTGDDYLGDDADDDDFMTAIPGRRDDPVPAAANAPSPAPVSVANPQVAPLLTGDDYLDDDADDDDFMTAIPGRRDDPVPAAAKAPSPAPVSVANPQVAPLLTGDDYLDDDADDDESVDATPDPVVPAAFEADEEDYEDDYDDEDFQEQGQMDPVVTERGRERADAENFAAQRRETEEAEREAQLQRDVKAQAQTERESLRAAETELKRAREEERAVKRAEAEAVRREEEEERAVRRAEEEERAVRRAEEEAEAARRAEEEERAVRRAEEEERAVRRAEEEERAVRRAEEKTEAARRAEEEVDAEATKRAEQERAWTHQLRAEREARRSKAQEQAEREAVAAAVAEKEREEGLKRAAEAASAGNAGGDEEYMDESYAEDDFPEETVSVTQTQTPPASVSAVPGVDAAEEVQEAAGVQTVMPVAVPSVRAQAAAQATPRQPDDDSEAVEEPSEEPGAGGRGRDGAGHRGSDLREINTSPIRVGVGAEAAEVCERIDAVPPKPSVRELKSLKQKLIRLKSSNRDNSGLAQTGAGAAAELDSPSLVDKVWNDSTRLAPSLSTRFRRELSGADASPSPPKHRSPSKGGPEAPVNDQTSQETGTGSPARIPNSSPGPNPSPPRRPADFLAIHNERVALRKQEEQTRAELVRREKEEKRAALQISLRRREETLKARVAKQRERDQIDRRRRQIKLELERNQLEQEKKALELIRLEKLEESRRLAEAHRSCANREERERLGLAIARDKFQKQKLHDLCVAYDPSMPTGVYLRHNQHVDKHLARHSPRTDDLGLQEVLNQAMLSDDPAVVERAHRRERYATVAKLKRLAELEEAEEARQRLQRRREQDAAEAAAKLKRKQESARQRADYLEYVAARKIKKYADAVLERVERQKGTGGRGRARPVPLSALLDDTPPDSSEGLAPRAPAQPKASGALAGSLAQAVGNRGGRVQRPAAKPVPPEAHAHAPSHAPAQPTQLEPNPQPHKPDGGGGKSRPGGVRFHEPAKHETGDSADAEVPRKRLAKTPPPRAAPPEPDSDSDLDDFLDNLQHSAAPPKSDPAPAKEATMSVTMPEDPCQDELFSPPAENVGVDVFSEQGMQGELAPRHQVRITEYAISPTVLVDSGAVSPSGGEGASAPGSASSGEGVVVEEGEEDYSAEWD